VFQPEHFSHFAVFQLVPTIPAEVFQLEHFGTIRGRRVQRPWSQPSNYPRKNLAMCSCWNTGRVLHTNSLPCTAFFIAF